VPGGVGNKLPSAVVTIGLVVDMVAVFRVESKTVSEGRTELGQQATNLIRNRTSLPPQGTESRPRQCDDFVGKAVRRGLVQTS